MFRTGRDRELCLAQPESCAENLGCIEVEEKTYWPNESFSSVWIEALSENYHQKLKNERNKNQIIKGPMSTEFILRVVGDFKSLQVMLKKKKWSVIQKG